MTDREGARSKRGRSRDSLDRCPRCGLHLRSCLCACLEPLALATRVIVLRHRRELHKPTNSGRLVPLTLVHSEVRTFGARDVALDTAGLVDPARHSLLLYPSTDSRELTRSELSAGPITLIVPDADWRRAFKFVAREPTLLGVQRVHLPSGPPSTYRLRRHSDPRFLATFEAIARALGILEGPDVQTRLEHVFRLMVERTLYSRGRVDAYASPTPQP
jgi:DTW domain-containing protein YfiP